MCAFRLEISSLRLSLFYCYFSVIHTWTLPLCGLFKSIDILVCRKATGEGEVMLTWESCPPGSALHGLAHQDLHGPSSTTVDLVVHHVFQSLVVGGTQEYLGIDLPPRVTIVHHLIASQLVPVLLEKGRDFLHVHSIIEGRSITDFTLI